MIGRNLSLILDLELSNVSINFFLTISTTDNFGTRFLRLATRVRRPTTDGLKLAVGAMGIINSEKIWPGMQPFPSLPFPSYQRESLSHSRCALERRQRATAAVAWRAARVIGIRKDVGREPTRRSVKSCEPTEVQKPLCLTPVRIIPS